MLCKENDQTLKLLVMYGSEHNFSAGMDITELLPTNGREKIKSLINLRENIITRIERLHCPTIAILEGYTIGYGIALALAFDLRVGTTQSKISIPAGKVGLLEPYGFTSKLVSLIGPSKLLDLLYTCDFIDGSNAFRIGLLDYLVNPDELDSLY